MLNVHCLGIQEVRLSIAEQSLLLLILDVNMGSKAFKSLDQDKQTQGEVRRGFLDVVRAEKMHLS